MFNTAWISSPTVPAVRRALHVAVAAGVNYEGALQDRERYTAEIADFGSVTDVERIRHAAEKMDHQGYLAKWKKIAGGSGAE